MDLKAYGAQTQRSEKKLRVIRPTHFPHGWGFPPDTIPQGGPSLHPRFGATQDDRDWFQEMQI